MTKVVPELPFETPGLLEALQDDDSLKIILQLQIRKSAATLKVLVKLTALPTAVVQAKLDQLCELRLVKALRASQAHREWRYKLASSEFCLRLDASNPDSWRRVCAHQVAQRDRIRREVEACRSKTVVPPMFQFFSTNTAFMTRAEQFELRARIRRVESFMAALEKRSHSGGPAAEGRGGAEKSTLHAVTLEVVPLDSPLSPQPLVHFLARGTPGDRQVAKSTDRALLSPRETEVARLLAEGLSRPQIAKTLRLSLHTVCTQSAAIYRKLGVRTRAHLARAILEAEGAAVRPDRARAPT
jgi:DNA-binding CsgD family transcriptional regulator